MFCRCVATEIKQMASYIVTLDNVSRERYENKIECLAGVDPYRVKVDGLHVPRNVDYGKIFEYCRAFLFT